MTNEEAIIEIKDASDSEVRYGDTKHHYDEVIKRVAAFDMAIKALAQEPCEDCISRQEAIKAIQNEYYDHAVGIDIVDIVAHLPSVTPKAEQQPDVKTIYNIAFTDGVNAYKNVIELAEEETEWIPCSERLPEDGDTYLVTIEYNGKVIGVDAASYSPVEGYIDKHWDTFNDWKEDDDTCYHVTAWMPLPEEYKKEGKK